ncbi:hypothetical protein BDW62DRAFT_8402 [Aspergillus aurantiobrunneus]
MMEFAVMTYSVNPDTLTPGDATLNKLVLQPQLITRWCLRKNKRQQTVYEERTLDDSERQPVVISLKNQAGEHTKQLRTVLYGQRVEFQCQILLVKFSCKRRLSRLEYAIHNAILEVLQEYPSNGPDIRIWFPTKSRDMSRKYGLYRLTSHADF